MYLHAPSGNLYRRNREDWVDDNGGRKFKIGSGYL